MKKIILMLFLLLFVPVVFAEEKFVPQNLTVTIKDANIIIKTGSITGKEFKYEGITNSTDIEETIEYITRTDLECTETQLTNLTEKLVDACTQIGDYNDKVADIFEANTRCSLKVENLTTEFRLADGKVQECESKNSVTCGGLGELSCVNYQDLNTRLTTAESKADSALGKYGWVGVVASIGMIIYIYNERVKQGKKIWGSDHRK